MLNAKEEEIMLEESRDVEKDRNGYELWLDANKCDLCYEFCEEKFPTCRQA